jgi:hypothetical protein
MLRITPWALLALVAAGCSFKPLTSPDASVGDTGAPDTDNQSGADATGGADGPAADLAWPSDGVTPPDGPDADWPEDRGEAGASDLRPDAPVPDAPAADLAGPADLAANPADLGANRKGNGEACTAGAECASTTCADGVCCNSACTGQCQACDGDGTKGVCLPVVGSPRGSRPGCMGAGTLCAGSCNGTTGAACTYPGSEKLCGIASCKDNDNALPAATCDGQGGCPSPAPVPCAPYTCGPTSCAGGCSPSNPCTGNNYCAAGKCTPKLAQGASCSDGTQCASGQCADGVCCDRACPGDCEACNLAGKAGTCSFQQGNVCRDSKGACDPDETCPGNAATCPADALRPSSFVCRPANGPCSPELKCTGSATACPSPPPPASLMCPASCSGNTFTPASVCADATTCSGQPQSCGNHACALTGCKSPCGSNSDCLAGFNCNGSGACVACPALPAYCMGGMSNGTSCPASDTSGTQVGTCTTSGACVTGSLSTCQAGQYCSGAYPSAACVAPTPAGTYGPTPSYVSRGPGQGMFGDRITLSSELVVRKFGLVTENDFGGKVTFALYTNVGGAPGALVAKAENGTIAVTGRNEFTAAPKTPGASLKLPAGQYWLLLALEVNTVVHVLFVDPTGMVAQKTFPYTFGAAVPDPAPTSSDFISAGMVNNFYITGTPP